MHRTSFTLSFTAIALCLSLSACDTPTRPDYRIKLIDSVDGKHQIAIPPECAHWDGKTPPLHNESGVTYGCATARNLAAQLETADDLVNPDPLGPADATLTAATVRDYRAGQTQALINVHNDAPVAVQATGSGETQ